ncbi:MAG TPA: discoidin domain-containing protein, partial [Thermoguttaceae bacterium]|nr:discoidin domain-containing protein [Thermoguttaceae bacterium]
MPLHASDFSDEVQRALTSTGGIISTEDAPGAADGKITNAFSFHTGQDDPPWWQVDLGRPTSIALIRIYSPHYSERITKFRLLVSNDGQSWKTVYTHGTTTNEMKRFDVALQDVEARYVRIAASIPTWMHLDEVMVFGPGDRHTNLALGQPCDQSSTSRWSSRSVAQPQTRDWRLAFDVVRRVIDPILGRMGNSADLATRRDALIAENVLLDDDRWDALYREALRQSAEWIDVRQQFELIDLDALARALDDLAAHHPKRYTDVETLRARLAAYRTSFEPLQAAIAAGRPGAWNEAAELVAFQRDVLLRNPLLDFERMVLLRRKLGNNSRRAMGAALGVGTLNAHTNDSLQRTG